MEKQLLILDIDETLLFAAESRLSRLEDFRVGTYWIYARPYLLEFLEAAFDWFDVAIWTSAGSGYAACLVEQVIPNPNRLKFVWASERCTQRYDPEKLEPFWIKDFKKLKRAGYHLDRVIVVDDSPEKHQRNYGNLIRVTPFTGDPTDRELQTLIPFLNFLRSKENCRAIEKRDWKLIVQQIQQTVAESGR